MQFRLSLAGSGSDTAKAETATLLTGPSRERQGYGVRSTAYAVDLAWFESGFFSF